MSKRKMYFNYKSINTHYSVNNGETVKLRETCQFCNKPKKSKYDSDSGLYLCLTCKKARQVE